MALLQIAEPGMSTAPHQHRLAVGIDLGTTNSLVATVRHGVPEVLPCQAGRPLLPSIVHYAADGTVTVGERARAQEARDPRNTIVSVKRLIGRGRRDIEHVENLPYDFVDAPGMVQLRTVTFTRHSSALLGSRSIPACGAVPLVPINRQFSISRFFALITLTPWRWWFQQSTSRMTTSSQRGSASVAPM